MEIVVTDITTQLEVDVEYELFEVVVTASDLLIIDGGGGVQSVVGDGVGGTASDVVMTFPTTGQITEDVNDRFVTDAELAVIANTSGVNTGDQDISGIAINASDITALENEQITQNNAIALNTVKRSYPLADENRLANTSGTNTGDQDISGIATNASDITALENEQITQNDAIALNTVKRSYPLADENRLANTSGTNTGDQDIFKNIANSAGTTQFSASTNSDSIRIEGTGDTSVSFDPSTKKITINSVGGGIYLAGTGLDLVVDTFNLAGQALAFHQLSTDGLVYKSGATIGSRSIVGGIGISVANGSGSAGNPTISLDPISLDSLSNVAISTPSLGQILEYDGTNWVNATASGGGGGIGGSGTVNYLAKFTPDGSTLGDSLVYDNGSRVIIGDTVAAGSSGVLQLAGQLVFRKNSNRSIAIGESALQGFAYGGSEILIAIGFEAADNYVTGNSLIAIGRRAARYHHGFNNIAIGDFAMGVSTTMSSAALNTAVGNYSLSEITTGDSNSAYGYVSLRKLTTGSNNVGVGYATLSLLTTGGNNVGVGTNALLKNNGSFNVGVGTNALSEYLGSSSTALGYRALSKLVTGNDNTVVAFNGLSFLTSGASNTAMGSGAFERVVTASGNVAIGTNASARDSGSSFVTSIDNSVFIGAETRPLESSGDTNQIVIGYQAVGEGSYTTVIGASSTVSTHLYGELRVDTINNAIGDFVTTSATGILQKRTVDQVVTDFGLATSERENNTVIFDQNYIIGNVAARSGNVLFDFTGAKLGSTTWMYHDNSGAYTFPTEGAIYDFKSADLSGLVGNVLFAFTIVDLTPASEVVQIRLSLTESQMP